ncbi:MAG: hypothetical protein QM831_03045 [Kofleriaceae bacterium]
MNIGYAWGQLQRAIKAGAASRVVEWTAIIDQMKTGALAIGSRQPTAAPVWVTLDVRTGGFATGEYTGGGGLRPNELELAERLGVASSRRALNMHFLTTTAADELLASGCYRVTIPEEGALLAVAWLRQHGDIDRANQIIDEISPWFDALPFYPQLAETPVEQVETVRLQPLVDTLAQIANGTPQPHVAAMRASLLVWMPLRARAIGLALELEAPRADWDARFAQLQRDFANAGSPATGRASDAALVIHYLQNPAKNRTELARLVSRYVAKYGTPGTAAHDDRLASKQRAVAGPLHADLRRVVVDRLQSLPRDGGVDPERVLAPITNEEARTYRVPVGAALPSYLEPKIARSCDADLEQLVDRHVIGSGEVFAKVLPQVTQQVRGATLEPTAAVLYAQLYLAFRRRRGLLLLNYANQVRFTELPWAAALDATRAINADATSRARRVVTRTMATVLRAFPYTITPNKLVTELYSLTDAAELKLPFVEELAADIFMGSFTGKFVEAAHRAAHVYAGTLYERYYAIDARAVEQLPVPAKGQTAGELAKLCQTRANTTYGTVPQNGKILEQAQILTTHNLAVLFDALPIADQLGARLRSLADTCFQFVLRRLSLRTRSYHEDLVNLKNAAYAWRQMVFFLSFEPDVPAFFAKARAHLAKYPQAFRDRFAPAMRGLELAAKGMRSDDPSFDAKVFTGWSTERHWLLPVRLANAT